MSQQGEAAEQIVNIATNVTVKGVECATNLAGKGALSLATFLIAVLKDQKRTKWSHEDRQCAGTFRKQVPKEHRAIQKIDDEAR